MKRSPLIGTTTGDFDSLRVRSPANTGDFIEVSSLVAGAAYDDTQLAQDVSANTSAIAGKASAGDVLTPVPAGAKFTDTISQVKYLGSFIDAPKLEFLNSTVSLGGSAGEYAVVPKPLLNDVQGLNTALAQKAESSAVYTQAEVDSLVAPMATLPVTTLQFSDVDGVGVNTLTIEGGDYIAIQDASGNALMDLDQAQLTLTPPTQCLSTLNVTGQLTANSLSSTSLNNALTLKQDALANAAYLDATSSVQAQLNARYTQSQVDDLLNDKADASVTYTISQVDANTYTQTQVDDLLDDKADSADLLQVYSGPSTWAEPTKMHFANSSFALDIAPGSATQGAWVVDPLPPISSVVGLTSALANKASAANATIGTALTVGGTGSATIHLEADSDDTTIYENPWVKWSQEGGAVAMEMGIVPGKSCIINWDSNGVGGASTGGYMMYFGIRNNNLWQTWVTDTTNSWATASDARLKTVLGPLENCTAKLAAISPCYFQYNSDKTKKRRIGLLAQECQVDFPETVSEGPDDKMLGMAYGDLVPVLIQAINELTARVEGLEGKSTRKSARK